MKFRTPRATPRVSRLLWTIALALAGLVSLSAPRPVVAAALVVDRDDDATGLACTAAANDCTLRSAIQIANANGATADTISFAANHTINLTKALDLTADNTAIRAAAGQQVKINGAGIVLASPADYGNVFRITGSGVTLERLSIYGSLAGWSNIWITGTAQRITIANNVIGDDEGDPGGCGQSPVSFSGIYINSTGTVAGDAARAWIYGNVIECNQGTAGSSLNPGDGIVIVDSNAVKIGDDGLDSDESPRLNYIENNRRNGVTIQGGAADNLVRTSFIQFNGNSGVFVDGAPNTTIARNGIQNNTNTGIELVNGARNTVVGKTLTGELIDGNVIISNGREGIYVAGGTTQNNFIFGNLIGTNSANETGLGNGRNGVVVTNGARTTIIGITPSERNVIAGNGHSGIIVEGAADGTLIQANLIGTNSTGTAALGNGSLGSSGVQRAGVAISGGATDTVVGGSTVSNRNLISGNAGAGVYIGGATTTSTLIDGNWIGTNVEATAALGNGDAGIVVTSAGSTTLGHTDQFNPQIIAGNAREGILVQNTDGVQIRSSNVIGFSSATTLAGNGREGVLVVNGSNTTIAPYGVRNNGRAGIAITGAGSVNNTIIFTENRGNGGLAIDLGNDGLTRNDPGDGDSGPNTLLNYPIITGVVGTTATGTACSGCFVYVYRADGSVGAPFGGGGLLGGVPVSAGGTWSITVPMGTSRVELTAFTASGDNVSEMTPRPQVNLPIATR